VAAGSVTPMADDPAADDDSLRKQAKKVVARYRVPDGHKFRLKDDDPADTAGHAFDKPLARALLESET
jgi:hypothetical protein